MGRKDCFGMASGRNDCFLCLMVLARLAPDESTQAMSLEEVCIRASYIESQ